MTTASELEWVSLPYEKGSSMIKGTELAQALCGPFNRFAIVEVVGNTIDGVTGVVYRVRDADLVTDVEVQDGVRPPIVETYRDLDEAIAFCKGRGHAS